MKKLILVRQLSLVVLFGIQSLSVLASSELAQTYTLDGQLTQKSNGQVLLDSNAKIVIQIMDPTKTCLLYEEQQYVDTTTSDGYFNIQVGSATGAAKRTVNDAGRSMYQIFQNTSAITANSVSGQTCSGSTYTPTANDVRYFRLIVTPSSTGVADTLSPDTTMSAVPMATVAESLQGYKANQFLMTGTGDLTQTNLQSIFATGNTTKLLSLLSVSPSNYITKDSTSGLIQIPSGSGTPTGVAAGQIWYDSGNLKFYNGSSVLTIVNSNTTISGSNITSGTIGGSTAVNTTGTISATGLSAATANLNNLLLYDTNNAHKITMKAPSPASLTADYTLTWPSAVASSSGQVLTSDTSGNLSWTTASGGGGTVSVNAPITNAGTASAANLSITQSDSTHDGYLSSVNWNTFNSKLSSTLTSAQIFVGNGSNVATGVAASGDVSLANTGAFTVGGIKGVTVSTAPTVSGQVLRYNGTNITPNFVSMTDLRSQVTGTTALGTSCGSNQTLTYNTASDNLSCTNISITASQVSNLSLSAFVNGGNSFGGAASLGTSDNYDLNFKTNNTTKMSLSKSGYLGIGVTPSTYTLDVNGVSHFNSWMQVDDTITVGSSLDGGIKTMYILMNPQPSNGTGSRLSFETYNSGFAALVDQAYIDSVMTTNTAGAESSYLAFQSRVSGSTAERMRIHSNGYVGIGTTSPITLLDVAGAITSRPSGTSTGQTGQFVMRELAANGTNTYTLKAPDALSADRLLIFPDSNGSNGQVLTTNGSGVLSWSTPSGVGSTLTSIDSITGGTSGLQLSAGGTNQNLTLSGSGTGGVTTGSVTTITNNTTSSSSSSGALVVTGGVGVGGALNVAGNFSTSGTASISNSLVTPVIYGSSSASGTLTLDSTSNATKGNIFLAPSGGNVGIGTSSPTYTLDVAGQGHFTGTIGSDSYLVAGAPNDGGITTTLLGVNPRPSNGTGNRIGFENYNNGYNALIFTGYIDSVMTTNTVGSESSYFALSTMVSGTNTERMRIHSNGYFGFGTNSPTNYVSLGGNSARTIGMERHTTANTAGNSLTILAGGATSAATNKAGGNLILSSGTSTGTGSSSIQLQTAAAGSSGTTSQAPATRVTIDGNGNITSSAVADSSGNALDVNKNSQYTNAAYISITNNTNNGDSGFVNYNNSGGRITKLWTGGTTYATSVYQNRATLTNEYASGAGVGIETLAASGDIRFATGGDLTTNERMRIDSSV